MMREARQIVRVAVVAFAVVLAGCQDDGQQTASSPTVTAEGSAPAVDTEVSPGTATEPTAPASPTEHQVASPSFFPDEPADWHVALEIVDGPTTFTAADGVTLEVRHAWISTLADAPDRVIGEWPEEDPPSTVFTLDVRATNETSQDIAWVRDPGLEVAGTSLSPHAWVGSWLPELPPRTSSQAMLVYALPEDISADAVMSGEGRLEGGVASARDTGEKVGDELNLTFAWQPE
jgi:hypothetical protein